MIIICWNFVIGLYWNRILNIKNMNEKDILERVINIINPKLQETVNNLLVWERVGATKWLARVKLFKSLSDMLSGKEWIFRKNLLLKREIASGI